MSNKQARSAQPAAPEPDKLQYALRLTNFVAKLQPDSVAIFVSNPERTRSNDTEFPYRQSSDILYLNGFPEPDSALVVSNFGGERKLTMFVQPKDRAKEIWTGIRLGVEGARKHHLADEAYTVDKFAEVVGKLVGQAKQVYYKTGRNPHFDDEFNKLWSRKQKPLLNPEEIVHEMRLFKSDNELALMRYAAAVSAEAHSTAMRVSRPGLKEYQLQSVIEGVFRWHGAEYPAYGSIVAGGNNAIVLHYVSNRDELTDGDLVLVDAGCEYRGYAADITRTFPVNGRFTEAQREIYELVLKAQLAAITAARAGVPLSRVHDRAAAVMGKGLVKLGILPGSALKKAAKKSKKKARGKAALTLGDFFMHGTSHWLGIDVHDTGSYSAEGGSNDRRGNKSRLLEPGMVITVEPGLYFDAGDKRVPKRYRGIGVRIEDDVLITAEGNEVLTSGVPKTVAEIEALMAGEGRPSDRAEAAATVSLGSEDDDDAWMGER